MGQPLETHIRQLQDLYWSEADPDGRAFVPLADALRKAGEHVEAHRVLREGLERHPQLSSGHVVYGWVNRDRGHVQKAETSFREALTLDPRNVEALRGLVQILLEREELPEALGLLEVLEEEDPTDRGLPERIRDLRAEVEALATAPHELPAPAGSPWDDPGGAAEELDLAEATLQADRSGDGVEVEEDSPPPSPRVVEYDEPIPDTDGSQHGVVTVTLGEIYLRQGLLAQAEGVFELLLQEDPENDGLKQRLEEIQERRRSREPGRTGVASDPSTEKAPPPQTGTDGPGDGIREASQTLESEERHQVLEGLDPAEVVSIESLAPDRRPLRQPVDEPLPMDRLQPDDAVSIEVLAPDDPVSIDALAPEVPVSIDALAPTLTLPMGDLAPEGPLPTDRLRPDDAVSIEVLAPDDPVSIEVLAPDDPVSIHDLAPSDPVSIDDLAPDETRPQTPGEAS